MDRPSDELKIVSPPIIQSDVFRDAVKRMDAEIVLVFAIPEKVLFNNGREHSVQSNNLSH
jgi:hypothetical protein